ncbi:hypothetical protein TWF481_012042 [Arthrobotrys musiformis]|uniref:Uncharacterized protein n=1 Tax=Arthrobotrys musiformis TaxID=47236 RepID=A0AAV9VW07_9PEZI
MPCQGSDVFFHDVVFAVKAKHKYGSIAIIIESIKPELAYELKDVLSAQKDLDGEYIFNYDEVNNSATLELKFGEVTQKEKTEPAEEATEGPNLQTESEDPNEK